MSIESMTKWEIALLGAALFAILSAQITYKLTNTIASKFSFQTTMAGGPTLYGVLIHFLVFFLLFRLILVFVN